MILSNVSTNEVSALENQANAAVAYLLPNYRCTAELADELVAQIGTALFDRARVLPRLTELEATLERSATFFPEEMCYLRNRLHSIRCLLDAGEQGAARYEMREMARKLRRWESVEGNHA